MFKTKINVTNTRECLFKYQNESADGQISLKKNLNRYMYQCKQKQGTSLCFYSKQIRVCIFLIIFRPTLKFWLSFEMHY